MAKESVEETAARLEKSTPRIPAIPPEDFLSTGCTVLNMAFSGTPTGGVPKGKYLYIIGDSGSSKTWFTFNMYAEANRNRHFKDYRFVFDNAENGALMDVAHYFGQGVRDRLEPPAADSEGSRTVQEFYYNLEANVRKGPCIYVLDSMDALNDDADEEKFEAEMKHHFTGKGEVPGSMGMAKAKTNSRNINRVAQTLRTNGSILVVISQTRNKIGAQYPTRTRGGGDALKFYAHLEIWTKVKSPLTKTYRRKEREIGDLIQITVQKNRVCGWEGAVPLVSFVKGYGVDDIGTCVDYLVDERYWSTIRKKKDAEDDDDDVEDVDGKNPPFAAPEFNFEGRKEALIKLVQEKEEEYRVHQLVNKLWKEIVAGSMPNRKPRYS